MTLPELESKLKCMEGVHGFSITVFVPEVMVADYITIEYASTKLTMNGETYDSIPEVLADIKEMSDE